MMFAPFIKLAALPRRQRPAHAARTFLDHAFNAADGRAAGPARTKKTALAQDCTAPLRMNTESSAREIQTAFPCR